MRNILTLVLFLIFVTSCTESKKELKRKGDTVLLRLEGGRYKGGTFRFNEVNQVEAINPLVIRKGAAWRIAVQIYEGLVKFDAKTLEVIPSLAKNWEISDDGKNYTFFLRKGVKFHENQCFGSSKTREVTAKDFYFCFTKLCEYSKLPRNFELISPYIEGAEDYFENTKIKQDMPNGVAGLRVIDDYTFSINLIKPCNEFLKILGTSVGWVYPREALDFYADEFSINPVGTGPFRLARWDNEAEKLYLEKNNQYWRQDKFGNTLPYLDGLEISFISNKRKELFTFKRGGLDMIYQLPVGLINEVVGKFEEALQGGNRPFKLQTNTAMGLRYYEFNFNNSFFDNVYLRKALNYAVNRNELITHVLKGEGFPANFGVIPPSFLEYPSEEINGFNYNPELAQKCLSKAGIKAKDLPLSLELRIKEIDEATLKIAQAIKQMIKQNLNIDLEIVEMAYVPEMNEVGMYDTSVAYIVDKSWIADYPDPANFLRVLNKDFLKEFEGNDNKKVMSSLLWNNNSVNNLRMEELKEIDQKAIDRAMVIPLYYNESIRLLSLSVENFPINSWEYRDFSEVYFNNRYKR